MADERSRRRALVLAIDTSTRGGSVAIGDEEGALLEAVHLDPERGHGSDLMPPRAEAEARA